MLFRRDPPRRSSPPGLWADMSRQRRLATAWGGPQWLSRAVESCPELSRGDARERPLMQEVLESCGRLAGTVSGCALHVLCGMQELTLGISNSQDPCHSSFLICCVPILLCRNKTKKGKDKHPCLLGFRDPPVGRRRRATVLHQHRASSRPRSRTSRRGVNVGSGRRRVYK